MPGAWKPKTILIIDDEEMLHELVRSYLVKEGYRCEHAKTGHEGLHLLQRVHPDLILLDYMLPDMEGPEVFHTICTNPEFEPFRTVPVIILTARDPDPELQSQLLKRGISAFLHKPFGLRELYNIIQNVLVIHEIRQRNEFLTREIKKTRDFLELILNSTPLAIFTTDLQGNIVHVNKQFLQYFPQNEQVIGLNVLRQDVFRNATLMSYFDRLLNTGQAFNLESVEIFTDPYHDIKVNFLGVPLQQAGQLTGAVGIIQDVTESEKKAYEFYLLSQISQAMQSTLDLDVLLHLILTSITAGCALGFSRAMIFLLNAQKKQLVGRMGVGPASAEDAYRIWSSLEHERSTSLTEFLQKYGKRKPDRNDPFNNLVKSIRIPLQQKTCLLVKAVLEKKDYHIQAGVPKLLCDEVFEKLQLDEFIAIPLITENKVLGLIVADNLYSGHPIDENRVSLLKLLAQQAALAVERTEAYRNLARQKATLEATLRQLRATQKQLIHSERLATVGKMAAHVAHEIRNPLVTIGGFANAMLRYTGDNSQLQEMANIIIQETRRLEKILSNVLDYSRIPKPSLKQGNINKIILEVCQLIQNEVDRKEIHCEKQLDDSIPEFFFDPAQIKQVLINLLRNAVQSIKNPPGLIKIVNRKINSKEIQIQISDTGEGMQKEILENIFNPFFSTKSDGTGLGLAIVQQIVHDHGGTIHVQSQPGHGTTFTLNLPVHLTPQNQNMQLEQTEAIS